MVNKAVLKPGKLKAGSWRRDFRLNYDLYLLSIPAFVLFAVFCYFPMYGLQIAFRDFMPSLGITGSEWIGLENFIRFFRSFIAWPLIRNTLFISVYGLLWGFPAPIFLALMLNELKQARFKKTVQTVTYAPYFMSTVAIVGMITIFTAPESGIINHFIALFGGERVNFLSKPEYFRTIFIASGIWESAGWGSIIYIAALSGVDPQLYEAATIDGANRLQRIWNVDIPCIMPTMVIMLILRMGHIMSVGFEKVLLLQNPLNLNVSEVISTYVYQVGLIRGEYSFSAAVGLFNNVINLILLVCVNKIARKISETSLW